MTETVMISNKDSIRLHAFLLKHIPHGRENATSLKELSRVIGIDQRQVRKLIETARIDGVIIAGTDDGIFFPLTRDELREYVKRTQKRIKTSLDTIAPAEKALEEWSDE